MLTIFGPNIISLIYDQELILLATVPKSSQNRMTTLQKIQETLKRLKPALIARYSIKSIAIFGSYARNTQGDTSDVDILVEFHENIGIRFIDLAEEIETSLGIRIDLVSRNGIKEKYFNAIQNDLIYV